MSSQIIRSQVGFPRAQRAAADVDHTPIEHTRLDHQADVHYMLVDVGLMVALLSTVIFFAIQLL